ncbi:MAG: hypothetical protein AAGE96_22040 [Cyanobacteria bacterium P01_G01_bin.19]
MTIIKVKTKQDWQLFHRVPHLVYQGDVNWIAPLESDIESIFDPQQNILLQKGAAKCFVLTESDRLCGRIAAFISDREPIDGRILGGIGFFECFDNPSHASSLFAAAEQYLQSQGVTSIDAPINFGSRDRYWGLLIKGFEPPLFQENYHPPYYQQLFLQNNYQLQEQILTYGGNVAEMPFKRLRNIAQRLKQRQPIYVKKFDWKEQERFVRDFCIISQATFPHNPVSYEQVNQMLDRTKDILDPNLMCIGYYQDRPAGYIVLYPNINPWLKSARGKLSFWNLPLFWLQKQLALASAKGISIGIHPDYQERGIVALLIDFLCSQWNLRRYPQIYLAGIATQNHQIRSIYEKLNLDIVRVHCTYRKDLNQRLAT